MLPGPEAHELCVYFGRLRGGKLGGFLAGLGFMLPGFLLMLGLSVLYVEANLAGHLEELFYGLTAAVGALVARALVRLGRTFVTDVPLALIAVAALRPDALRSAPASSSSCSAPASPTSCGRTGAAGPIAASSFSLGPLAVVAVAARARSRVSLTAEIFFEGLKAGLLTFGGAYTVIPFLQDSAVDGHHWLTDSQFVDGLAIGGILPAPLIIFSTFVGYLGGRPGRRPGDDARHLPPRLRLPDLPPPPARRRSPRTTRLSPSCSASPPAVIGLIAAVTVTILETSVVDVSTALIAIGAFAALNRWHSKLTVVYVMAAAGIVGVVLQHTVV